MLQCSWDQRMCPTIATTHIRGTCTRSDPSIDERGTRHPIASVSSRHLSPSPETRFWLPMGGAQVEGQSGLPVDNPTESYWHKEPSQKLLGHRTTADLPSTADVVIVGSGITGASAAHTLKERRPELDIVMLEAREACWGATGRVSHFACSFS